MSFENIKEKICYPMPNIKSILPLASEVKNYADYMRKHQYERKIIKLTNWVYDNIEVAARSGRKNADVYFSSEEDLNIFIDNIYPSIFEKGYQIYYKKRDETKDFIILISWDNLDLISLEYKKLDIKG